MHGNSTPDNDAHLSVEAFAAEAAAFLGRHARRRRSRGPFRWGAGSDRVAIFDEPLGRGEDLERARGWRRSVYDAGFGAITAPVEHGGRGLSPAHERRYYELERQYETPTKTPFNIGLGMVAPTIMAHGSDALRRKYLPALYRGDLIACQLFSEPGAGSDLASVATSARPADDRWVVHGQKVWTSGAHFSDIGLLLARTAAGPRHRNLTAFVIDMRAPGIEIRPLRQMTGGAAFNEVFLDGAVVPDDHRLGEIDGGWTVALTTLMNERGAVGRPGSGGAGTLSTERLLAMARHFDVAGDPVLRQAIARTYVNLAVARYTRLRIEARRRAGQAPGPELSTGKLALTQNLAAVSHLVSGILGPRLLADTGEWGTWAWGEFVLGVPGLRLGGGTDEIQRNILAERVLGLPREPDTGKGSL